MIINFTSGINSIIDQFNINFFPLVSYKIFFIINFLFPTSKSPIKILFSIYFIASPTCFHLSILLQPRYMSVVINSLPRDTCSKQSFHQDFDATQHRIQRKGKEEQETWNEIYAAIFGSHLFMTNFYKARGRPWAPWPPPRIRHCHSPIRDGNFKINLPEQKFTRPNFPLQKKQNKSKQFMYYKLDIVTLENNFWRVSKIFPCFFAKCNCPVVKWFACW